MVAPILAILVPFFFLSPEAAYPPQTLIPFVSLPTQTRLSSSAGEVPAVPGWLVQASLSPPAVGFDF